MSSLTQTQRVRLLYKGILRLHRSLPSPMKDIGDSYVKEEFKRHKKANAAQTMVFMQEWTKYYVTVSNQIGRSGKTHTLGQKIGEEGLDYFTEDQLVQLHELYKELKEPNAEGGKEG